MLGKCELADIVSTVLVIGWGTVYRVVRVYVCHRMKCLFSRIPIYCPLAWTEEGEEKDAGLGVMDSTFIYCGGYKRA